MLSIKLGTIPCFIGSRVWSSRLKGDVLSKKYDKPFRITPRLPGDAK